MSFFFFNEDHFLDVSLSFLGFFHVLNFFQCALPDYETIDLVSSDLIDDKILLFGANNVIFWFQELGNLKYLFRLYLKCNSMQNLIYLSLTAMSPILGSRFKLKENRNRNFQRL